MTAIKMILGDMKTEFSEYDGMNIEELMQEREKLNKLLEENDDKGTK